MTLSSQKKREIRAQQAAVRALRRQLSGLDGSSRRSYIREFARDFDDFMEPASYDDLVVRGYRADIIYVGDYHALPACQAFAARYLADLCRRSSRVVLAVELIYGRQQPILDEWLEGRIDDDELLRRLRYDEEWGYHWPSYRAVLDTARQAAVPVIGIDREPRTGFRQIRRRDAYAAERIGEIFTGRPDAKVMVLIGESHLARSHLPAQVTRRLLSRQMEKRTLTVVQNVDALYWKRAERELDSVEVLRVEGRRYCVFNSSPLAKYEAYRQVLERWQAEGGDDDLDLAPTVHNMIDTLLRFLRIDRDRLVVARRDGFRLRLSDVLPEVYAGEEPGFVAGMLQRHGLDEEQTRQVLGHLGRAGSCYVPRINAIFIGAFDLTHAGEEASHFVNFALRGEIYDGWQGAPRPAHDRFYGEVMDEAVGFFGSKLIDPARNHFFETDFYRYYGKEPAEVEARTGYAFAEFRAIIDFILLHKRFERGYAEHGEVPPELLAGIRSTGDRFRILTHELGYFLGQQIHDGLRRGLVSHDQVTALYRQRWDKESSALSAYLDWAARLAPLGGG